MYNAARYVCAQPDMEAIQLVSFGCGIEEWPVLRADNIRPYVRLRRLSSFGGRGIGMAARRVVAPYARLRNLPRFDGRHQGADADLHRPQVADGGRGGLFRGQGPPARAEPVDLPRPDVQRRPVRLIAAIRERMRIFTAPRLLMSSIFSWVYSLPPPFSL